MFKFIDYTVRDDRASSRAGLALRGCADAALWNSCQQSPRWFVHLVVVHHTRCLLSARPGGSVTRDRHRQPVPISTGSIPPDAPSGRGNAVPQYGQSVRVTLTGVSPQHTQTGREGSWAFTIAGGCSIVVRIDPVAYICAPALLTTGFVDVVSMTLAKCPVPTREGGYCQTRAGDITRSRRSKMHASSRRKCGRTEQASSRRRV
jgi:hypothetical protein